MKIQSDVINQNLCISCGLCAYKGSADMIMKKGIYLPQFKKNLRRQEDELFYDICPGKGYDIFNMGKTLFNNVKCKYDYRIGYYQSIGALYSTDVDFIKKSSSGGIMPALAFFLLEEKIVDGILTVRFKYTSKGPVPEPFIAKNKEELITAQGSKYMPVPLLDQIDHILKFPGNLAVIGTPCQIAGLRLFQNKNEELKNKIKFTIANFCGGFRDFRETERIFEIFKVEKQNISYFSYRGNGQPGTMTIHQQNKQPIQIKYPEYARLTGYTKFYRCRTCVDATGELADISFGDAWLPRFLNSGKKWSINICRTEEAQLLLEKMIDKRLINITSIGIEELAMSQKGNLITKKERQNSRYHLYKLIGMRVPQFDGGYNTSKLNMKLEIKVFLNHKLMYLLEKLGLYLPASKFFKRVKKNNYEIKVSNFMP